jgi:diguanylate cyclase (GGDEF)-like protein
MNFAAFRTGDPILQIFVVTVQSGWLGAGCVRNAASPAAAFWQLVLVLVPCMICLSFSHDHILHALVPFAAIQFSATSGIAHSIGSQITGTMISEQRLEAANARLTELSATDGLTGIANRRAFDAALTAEWGRAARDGTDLGLLVIDVDYFKAFNDHYGHPAGDECLRLVAALTARTLRRPPDTAARFGGEEFVALLPGTSALAAMEVAERVRCAIMESGVLHQASVFGCVTVSIGAASLSPHPGSEAQMLIDLADKALYRAKDSGRNTVRCASDGLEIGLPAWSAARERAR